MKHVIQTITATWLINKVAVIVDVRLVRWVSGWFGGSQGLPGHDPVTFVGPKRPTVLCISLLNGL